MYFANNIQVLEKNVISEIQIFVIPSDLDFSLIPTSGRLIALGAGIGGFELERRVVTSCDCLLISFLSLFLVHDGIISTFGRLPSVFRCFPAFSLC